MLTRRAFTGRLAAMAMGGVALGSCSRFSSVSRRLSKGGYVDVHTHLTQRWGDKKPLAAGGLLRWMDRNDIAQAVVLPLVSPESWSHPVSTDYVLEETRAHRDRLIPFCAIDPRTINLGGKRGIIDQLRRFIDAGARGFGEHKPGVAIDDARNMRLFEALSEVHLPVLFHLDNQRNFDKPGLPGLGRVLRSFPALTMIGHAQGWWASIDGAVTQEEMQGYPDRPVQAGGAIDRLMESYPNIYGDLSAGSGANAISRDLEFGREFLVRRADRLLFGTDYLEPGQSVPQFELYRTIGLPLEVENKIYRENARRILRLEAGS